MADPVPVGWLARLRRLRNRSAPHSTVARHHDPNSRGRLAVTGLVVDGLPGPVDPAAWLENCLDLTVDLCADMLNDAAATGHLVPE